MIKVADLKVKSWQPFEGWQLSTKEFGGFLKERYRSTVGHDVSLSALRTKRRPNRLKPPHNICWLPFFIA